MNKKNTSSQSLPRDTKKQFQGEKYTVTRHFIRNKDIASMIYTFARERADRDFRLS